MPHLLQAHAVRMLLMAMLASTPPLAGAGEHSAPAADATLLDFSTHLRSCQAASATQPHPLMRGFTIQHTIIGPEGARCAYTQSMPGGMRMVCAFDDAGRAAYAGELERTARTGAMSGGTNDAKPAWAASCEIETRDGKRLPME